MIKASPRLGALLAGGAALVAFGITGQAMAADNDPNCGHDFCHQHGQWSKNGKGKGPDKPAGETGKADNKYPPGQSLNDHNQGYECDGNEGVGKGNPAHSGCGGDYPDTCY